MKLRIQSEKTVHYETIIEVDDDKVMEIYKEHIDQNIIDMEEQFPNIQTDNFTRRDTLEAIIDCVDIEETFRNGGIDFDDLHEEKKEIGFEYEFYSDIQIIKED